MPSPLELTQQQKLFMDRVDSNMNNSMADGVEYPPGTEVIPALPGYASAASAGITPQDYRPTVRDSFLNPLATLITSVDPVHAATLLNGWVQQGGFNTAGYWIDPWNAVHLQGSVGAGSGVIFTLPAGYRPSGTVYLVGLAYNGMAYSATRVVVSTSGDVTTDGPNTLVSLEGLTFRADP